MKFIQSASLPVGDVKIELTPVEGQSGLFSVENAYSGDYLFFRREADLKPATAKNGDSLRYDLKVERDHL